MSKDAPGRGTGKSFVPQDADGAGNRVQPSDTIQQPNLDMMSKTLAGLQDQVKFADAKATFTAGLNVLLFGFVVSNAEKLAAIPAPRSWAFYTAVVLLILYGLAAFISMIFVIVAILPRFGELAPRSRTHFGHILKDYGKDYSRYCRDVQGMRPCDWAEDIGTQIVEVSHIARTKHLLARRAMLFTLVAMIFWVAGLVAALVAHH